MIDRQDYSQLNEQVNNLLAGSAVPRRGLQASRMTLKIEVSEMPNKIPAGSMVELEKVSPAELRFGDIIYIGSRDKSVPVLGRYVGLKGQDIQITQNGTNSSLHPPSKLVGRVVSVTHQSKTREFTNDKTLSRAVLRVRVGVSRLTGAQ